MTDNATTGADNTDNAAIDADNTDDAAIDAENATIDADNTDNATTDGDNTDDAETSNHNGACNMDNAVTGKVSTVYVPLPPCYGGKAKHPSQIKTSSRHTTAIAEPSSGAPFWTVKTL